MNNNSVPLLGQDPPQPQNESRDQVQTLTTAFVVWLDEHGRVGFSPAAELLAGDVMIRRPASADDMYGACSNVMRQITTQFTAVETHQVMLSHARAAAAAAQNARISEMVANGKLN